jgi:arylsulfatase A-like enzyme
MSIIKKYLNNMHKTINPLITLAAVSAFMSASVSAATAGNPLPNVIIIMTDDQGYGDMGITGNPHIKTPVLDRFARESIRFNQFYVSPVCSPTRASLMTGRYSLRTGVRATDIGGSIMSTEEITIAEVLKQAGYITGIFGKWHLGDTYPSRPSDQGFDESLIHLTGGIGQTGDFTNFFKGDSSYFDPVLWYNNEKKAYKGYCSDVFTSEAIRFIENNHQSRFFCYLSFNAPHTPLQVPEEYYNLYKDIDPSSGFGNDTRPFPEMTERNREDARKVYAMVTNIDDNVGRLLKRLDELKIADNTLVIFMTDNGPAQPRYVAGMRERKGSVYRGGVRVPFFLRLPSRFTGNRDIEIITAHIDILPSLSELCGAKMPEDRVIDGKSFLSILNGAKDASFENRTLFFYWTRKYPELYTNIALQKGPFKLVGNTDYNASPENFELFDIIEDEFEQRNIISDHLNLATEMKTELDKLLSELINSPNLLNPPRIVIGSRYENPVTLNINEAGGVNRNTWRVEIMPGRYNIRYKFREPLKMTGTMYLQMNTVILRMENKNNLSDVIEMNNITLSGMNCDLMPWYVFGNNTLTPFWVELERID